jgi:hypothetical protein
MKDHGYREEVMCHTATPATGANFMRAVEFKMLVIKIQKTAGLLASFP